MSGLLSDDGTAPNVVSFDPRATIPGLSLDANWMLFNNILNESSPGALSCENISPLYLLILCAEHFVKTLAKYGYGYYSIKDNHARSDRATDNYIFRTILLIHAEPVAHATSLGKGNAKELFFCSFHQRISALNLTLMRGDGRAK